MSRRHNRYNLDIDFLKSDYDFIIEQSKLYNGNLKMYVSSLIKRDQRIKKLPARARYAARAKAKLLDSAEGDIAATVEAVEEPISKVDEAMNNILAR